MTAVVDRARRPQAERAAQMRARLLDATISCLADTGYGAMSTNDVVRRAGVSRGALAHHFPTKDELVRAAAERLLARRAEQFRERFGRTAPRERTLAGALDILWSFYDDPSGIVLIELTVAARHNPELRPVIATVPEQIAALTTDVVAEFFPELGGLPRVDEMLRGIHALYAGLALGGMATADSAAAAEAAGHRDAVRALVADLAGAVNRQAQQVRQAKQARQAQPGEGDEA